MKIKRLLNAHEVASAPGLGRSLVYPLIATGELASIKMDCSRCVFVGATDEFMAWRIGGEVGLREERE